MGEIDVEKVLRERNDAQDQCARYRIVICHLCNGMTVSQLAAMRDDVLRTVLAVRFCGVLDDVADTLLDHPWPPREG